MVGQITLETYDQKILTGEKQKVDPVKEYIKRFSEAQHVFQEYGQGKNAAGKIFANELEKQFKKNYDQI